MSTASGTFRYSERQAEKPAGLRAAENVSSQGRRRSGSSRPARAGRVMKSRPAMVIVGAGQSGARTAHALRDNGWEGDITLLGNEGVAPYDRPPLSKGVLLGQKSTAECALYDEAFYRDQRIDLRTDATVERIDRATREVVLGGGHKVAYQRLLIATGAAPRRLNMPGATLEGVHTLRTAADAETIVGELMPGRRIAIVGAGFIGLEIAATAVARGCEVVVIEAAARALIPAMPQVVPPFLADPPLQI